MLSSGCAHFGNDVFVAVSNDVNDSIRIMNSNKTSHVGLNRMCAFSFYNRDKTDTERSEAKTGRHILLASPSGRIYVALSTLFCIHYLIDVEGSVAVFNTATTPLAFEWNPSEPNILILLLCNGTIEVFDTSQTIFDDIVPCIATLSVEGAITNGYALENAIINKEEAEEDSVRRIIANGANRRKERIPTSLQLTKYVHAIVDEDEILGEKVLTFTVLRDISGFHGYFLLGTNSCDIYCMCTDLLNTGFRNVLADGVEWPQRKFDSPRLLIRDAECARQSNCVPLAIKHTVVNSSASIHAIVILYSNFSIRVYYISENAIVNAQPSPLTSPSVIYELPEPAYASLDASIDEEKESFLCSLDVRMQLSDNIILVQLGDSAMLLALPLWEEEESAWRFRRPKLHEGFTQVPIAAFGDALAPPAPFFCVLPYDLTGHSIAIGRNELLIHPNNLRSPGVEIWEKLSILISIGLRAGTVGADLASEDKRTVSRLEEVLTLLSEASETWLQPVLNHNNKNIEDAADILEREMNGFQKRMTKVQAKTNEIEQRAQLVRERVGKALHDSNQFSDAMLSVSLDQAGVGAALEINRQLGIIHKGLNLLEKKKYI